MAASSAVPIPLILRFLASKQKIYSDYSHAWHCSMLMLLQVAVLAFGRRNNVRLESFRWARWNHLFWMQRQVRVLIIVCTF